MRTRLPLLVVPALLVFFLPSCQVFKKKGVDTSDPLAMDYPFDAQGNYIEPKAKKLGSGRQTPVVASVDVPPPLAPDTNYTPIKDSGAPPPPPVASVGEPTKPKPRSTAATPSKPKPKPQVVTRYTVKRGDTLSGIAKTHGVSVPALRKANGISGDIIRVGQQLRVPRGPGQAGVARSGGSKTTRGGGSASYTVKSGDSLSAIAGRNHTTVAKLKSANGLSSNLIRPGQKLKLP